MRKTRPIQGWKLYLALSLFAYPLLFAITWLVAGRQYRHLSLAAVATVATLSTLCLVIWVCVETWRKGHSN